MGQGVGVQALPPLAMPWASPSLSPLPLIILLTFPLAFVGQSPVVHFHEKGLDGFQAMALVWENSLRFLILQ